MNNENDFLYIDIPNGQIPNAIKNGAEKRPDGHFAIHKELLKLNPLFENWRQDKRLYLHTTQKDLPFLKENGARFDSNKKQWFAPAFTNQNVFKHLTGIKQYDINKSINEFKNYAEKQCGLIIDKIIPDGQFHHVPTIDDKNNTKQSGSYIFYPNVHSNSAPVGIIYNFKRNIENHKWIAENYTLTNNQNNQPAKDFAEKQLEFEKQKKEQEQKREIQYQNRAKEISSFILNENKTFMQNLHTYNVEKHPYMLKKQITSLDSNKPPNVLPINEHFVSIDNKNRLIIPFTDINNQIQTVQTIQQINTNFLKLIAKNSKKVGAFHVVGNKFNQIKNDSKIVISEGYATACSVESLLKHTKNNENTFSISAIDAGNIMHVAKQFKNKFKNSKIIIACDFDEVGIKKGQSSAESIGGYLIPPPNKELFKEFYFKITDYNDLNSTPKGFEIANQHFKNVFNNLENYKKESILNENLSEKKNDNSNKNLNNNDEINTNLFFLNQSNFGEQTMENNPVYAPTDDYQIDNYYMLDDMPEPPDYMMSEEPDYVPEPPDYMISEEANYMPEPPEYIEIPQEQIVQNQVAQNTQQNEINAKDKNIEDEITKIQQENNTLDDEIPSYIKNMPIQETQPAQVQTQTPQPEQVQEAQQVQNEQNSKEFEKFKRKILNTREDIFIKKVIIDTIMQAQAKNPETEKELFKLENIFSQEQIEKIKKSDTIIFDADDFLTQKQEGQEKTEYEQIDSNLQNQNATYLSMKTATKGIFNSFTKLLNKTIDSTLSVFERGLNRIENSIEKMEQNQKFQNIKETTKEKAAETLEKTDTFINSSFNKAEKIISKLREFFPNKAIIVTCSENTKHNINEIKEACIKNGIVFAQKGTETFKNLVQNTAEVVKNAKNTIDAKNETRITLEKMQKQMEQLNKKVDSICESINQKNEVQQTQKNGHTR